ncbi:GNAT family N-acetyltransferase [Chloroflexota bacterium]
MNDIWSKQVTLEGDLVVLSPLSIKYLDELTLAGSDPEIWKYMLYGEPKTREFMHIWIEDLLARRDTRGEIPFVVIFKNTGKAIGATRYLDIQPANRSLEIAGTWYATKYQRTGVNTESKYLLLKYAFEILGCIRVQFKTDKRNIRSQTAIERLGAVKEGILRNHIITNEGLIRDSVYYSILDKEWLNVKMKIIDRMNRE